MYMHKHTHSRGGALVGDLRARSVLPSLSSVNLIRQNEHLSNHREVKKKHPRDSQQVTTVLETKVIEECAQGFFLWLGELKMESTLGETVPLFHHCFIIPRPFVIVFVLSMKLTLRSVQTKVSSMEKKIRGRRG
jgi:hypothetical protein